MTTIQKLGRVMIPSADQDTAIAWYRDKLGFETKDARALHADLKGKGVGVDEGLMGGDGTVPLLFGFLDAEGNNLMVAESF